MPNTHLLAGPLSQTPNSIFYAYSPLLANLVIHCTVHIILITSYWLHYVQPHNVWLSSVRWIIWIRVVNLLYLWFFFLYLLDFLFQMHLFLLYSCCLKEISIAISFFKLLCICLFPFPYSVIFFQAFLLYLTDMVLISYLFHGVWSLICVQSLFSSNCVVSSSVF